MHYVHLLYMVYIWIHYKISDVLYKLQLHIYIKYILFNYFCDGDDISGYGSCNGNGGSIIGTSGSGNSSSVNSGSSNLIINSNSNSTSNNNSSSYWYLSGLGTSINFIIKI